MDGQEAGDGAGEIKFYDLTKVLTCFAGVGPAAFFLAAPCCKGLQNDCLAHLICIQNTELRIESGTEGEVHVQVGCSLSRMQILVFLQWLGPWLLCSVLEALFQWLPPYPCDL